jgi:CRISPR system Cascade subunit CasA
MAQSLDPPLTFNLWDDPWIPLKTRDNQDVRLGIAETLKAAHTLQSITAPSPLEIVGIHRLLVAVLQAAFAPQEFEDLSSIVQSPGFTEKVIDSFGSTYSARFDLFSPDQPFLQSADLPIQPEKASAAKTVSYLFAEYPSGTAIVHYHHTYDDRHYICPACAARALTVIPAFATSGGAGIKPSINGVPPIYVLPSGETLFESLAYSLILPNFQPSARSQSVDLAWWDRPPLVEKSSERIEVGYLHSLLFPARRVRLHPVRGNRSCTRCGEYSSIGVETMIFEMGESRPKASPFWQDPFAGYSVKGEKEPVPVRPTQGKATWREYGSLFLKSPGQSGDGKARFTMRPRVLDQFDALLSSMDIDAPLLSFRCIGMRTDMKAKVFEWIDTGFSVPLALLHSSDAGIDVDEALDFAGRAVGSLVGVFQEVLNRSKNGNRYVHLKNGLRDQLWNAYADPFRNFTLALAAIQTLSPNEQRDASKNLRFQWFDAVVEIGLRVFREIIEQLGDDGHSLRLRYQGLEEAHHRLYGQRKKEKSKYE